MKISFSKEIIVFNFLKKAKTFFFIFFLDRLFIKNLIIFNCRNVAFRHNVYIESTSLQLYYILSY